jgi:hypothetical protein
MERLMQEEEIKKVAMYKMQGFKKKLKLSAIIIGVSILIAAIVSGLNMEKSEQHIAVTKSDLEYMENLITQKIHVADILKAEHLNDLYGRSTATWAIEGTALISVDLSEMKMEYNENTKTLTITLPSPQILNFKIDQYRTGNLKIQKALLDNDKLIGNIRNESMRQAEKALKFKINRMGYKERSKDEAVKVLRNFFTKQLGYQNVKFVWN